MLRPFMMIRQKTLPLPIRRIGADRGHKVLCQPVAPTNPQTACKPAGVVSDEEVCLFLGSLHKYEPVGGPT